jgi:6-pyruvoyltetrahydropterin/6-carboxytetrahydropterin synthase
MSLHGKDADCNPSAEHISKELFMSIAMLMDTDNIRLEKVVLYETPNCWVECTNDCITKEEWMNFREVREDEILKYREEKGVFEYDIRNVK